ncbi:unnamed protein product [Adineta steineri]|uniref:Iodothyronine deiodinase n=1 Tax=Adineta steineri TaxID=433720 RepID=A0A818KHF8_9BILA|nr:unnamed protein product [Adineta steineri]
MDIYKDQIDLITVYIEEAHASDEWPIGSRISYVQPKCDVDRIRIAKDFVETTKYRIRLLIDPVSRDNPFSKMYNPWPIRFYVIDKMRRFRSIAEPIKGSYSLELIKDALDEVIHQQQDE